MYKFITFILTFFILFGVTVGFLALVDALPDTNPTPYSSTTPESQTYLPAGQGDVPVRIVIKDIKLDDPVSNPDTTDVDVLDQALLKGAIHYPGTAALGEQGTVLLFGHSSYLPIVHNQNYKAFDGIQNLKTGEIISLYSSNTEYRFSVVGVRQANVNDDPIVELPQDGEHLTLVTCDSFATKSDRFIVTADFVGAYGLLPSGS